TIQGAVVGGAVFSTYVLWHIVNGPVSSLISEHTEKKFSDSLMVQLLNSDNYHYQYYALNRISEDETHKYLPYIIRLISDGIAYVPYFAIEKIPIEAWKTADTQHHIIRLIDSLDFEMQNEVLNRMNGISLSASSCNLLIASLGNLKESQVIKALEILKLNSDSISPESMANISSLVGHPNKEVSALSSQITKE